MISPSRTAVLLLVVGCSSPSGATDGPGGDGDAATSSPDGGAACTDCAPGGDGGAGDSGTTDGAAPVVPPVLAILAAHQAGRAGEDLLLSFSGTDVNQSSFGLDIQLRDQAGNPVDGFKDWSGAPVFDRRIVLFDNASAAGKKDFSATVTLPGVMRDFKAIAQVKAAIVDPLAASNVLGSSVAVQPVKNLAQVCDPLVVDDRCSPGLACDRASSVCTKPASPKLDAFAYLTSPIGARMLFAGTDPADDLDTLHLEFLDNGGSPVLIDLTGNQDYASTFDVKVSAASALGAFFYAVQSAPSFSTTVTQLAATPSGTASGTGDRVTAMLQAPITAASGGACDLRGFAVCGASESCVAGTCVSTAKALADAAAAAPRIDPTGRTLATGYATGAALWGDPPSDCVTAGAHALPQGIAVLHLPQAMPSITLTTDNEETNVRAALVVLGGAGASVGTKALGCNSGLPARATLKNLPAGDYTVVVTAQNAAGGHFGVSVQ